MKKLPRCLTLQTRTEIITFLENFSGSMHKMIGIKCSNMKCRIHFPNDFIVIDRNAIFNDGILTVKIPVRSRQILNMKCVQLLITKSESRKKSPI